MSTKTKKQPTRKPTWRDYSDSLHRSFTLRPNPESLHPGEDTVLRAISGNEEARAILSSYAFRFPVTTQAVL
jgi:hypothetical protein